MEIETTINTTSLSSETARKSLHKCVVCSRNFKYFTSLIEHELTHATDRSYNLQQHENNFKSEMQEQTMIRPHKCTTCGKRFTLHENLNRHQMVHTNKRPFQCTHCPKSFRLSQHLKEHIRIHTGEKPYKCTTCGHAFCQISNLKSHQKTHSKDKAFKCELCGKSFRRSFTLKQHKATHVNPIGLVDSQLSTNQKQISTGRVYSEAKTEVAFSKNTSNDTRNRIFGVSCDTDNISFVTNSPGHESTKSYANSIPESPNSLEQLNALQNKYLSMPNYFKEDCNANYIQDIQVENFKGFDYKWKRQICRGWISPENVTSKLMTSVKNDVMATKTKGKHGDISHKNESSPESRRLNRFSSEGSETWSPNSFASSNYENHSNIEHVRSQKDVPDYTRKSYDSLNASATKTDIDLSPTFSGSRTPTADLQNNLPYPLFGYKNNKNVFPTAKLNNFYLNDVLNGQNTLIDHSDINRATLQAIANHVSFVPLIEWKPVVTGWRNVLDGSVYSNCPKP